MMDKNFIYIVYRHDDDIVALLLSDSQYAQSNPRDSETPLNYNISVPTNMKDYKIIVASSKFEALRKYFQQEDHTILYQPGDR